MLFWIYLTALEAIPCLRLYAKERRLTLNCTVETVQLYYADSRDSVSINAIKRS